MSEPLVPPSLPADRFRRVFLLTLAGGISILFLLVIQRFVLTVLVAAILAGLAQPLQGWWMERTGGRRGWAAGITLLLLLLGVGLPLAGFLTLVATEAVQVGQAAERWFRDPGAAADPLRWLPARVPFLERFLPDPQTWVGPLRELGSRVGPALMGVVASATRSTLNFLLQAFVLVYALFFFLKDGPRILQQILGYLPLAPQEKAALLERFVSVSRATLRGSLLIGLIQGALAGLAFWAAGISGAAFWGTIMVVLSIIPAVGAALVWVPAVGYLFAIGKTGTALLLLLWCGGVVGSVDNFLRPLWIGRDAQMSDLLILLSTLGGIVLFGAVGFLVGPIVAALFVTIWGFYGEAFRDWLPSSEGPA